MEKIGRRLIIDKTNNKVICDLGEAYGEGLLPRENLGELVVLDLPFGKYKYEFNNLKYGLNSIKVKDFETNELEFILNEPVETKEEKLLREKRELENQLLLAENKNLGGIL